MQSRAVIKYLQMESVGSVGRVLLFVLVRGVVVIGPVRFSYNLSFSACFLIKILFFFITNQSEQYFDLFFQQNK